MATTTSSNNKTTTPATSNVPTYQQAYDMSADWLSRTVKAGQDTAATAAQAKDYYTGQNQGRQSVYDQLNATAAASAAAAGAAPSTFKDSQDFARSALDGGRTVSFKSTKTTGPSDFDNQMRMFDAQNAAQAQADYMGNQYKAQDEARQFGYDQQAAAQDFARKQAATAQQNAFSASEAEKQRQLQAYLGNMDANTRLATSMFGSLNTSPAEYRYW